jgi:aspartate/methionine/tyrosine aminotransferase
MPESVFNTMDRAKHVARRKGLELVDLSIGSSDVAPPEVALQALREATYDPDTYGYCLFSRTQPLRHAAAAWFSKRFDRVLDPETQVLPLIGSQEGFANLLFAVTDPGDVILCPDPGYPSYFGAIALAGLQMVTMPLLEENGFLPDLSAITTQDATRARVMVLSYPNNPTAAVAPEAFFKEAIDFCHAHDILLMHDFPYVDMTYGDYRAPSVLALPGGLETAVELYSCSKSFHMGGFRIGWAAGHADVIAALVQVKGAVDFNQYLGIQRAAVASLEGAQAEAREAARVFEARRDALVRTLNASGWPAPLPQASMYVWTRLPEGFEDSFGFCVRLAEETGVCLAPGRAFGERGEGYVRFALVREPEAMRRAVARVRSFLD